MPDRHIVLNRICTPDGTILTSYSRYDYNYHIDRTDGIEYSVDGGTIYLKRSGTNYTDLSVYSDDDFEKVRESFYRHNSRTDEYVIMKDMSDDWLDSLIIYLREIIDDHTFPLDLYLRESQYRKIKNRDNIIDSF